MNLTLQLDQELKPYLLPAILRPKVDKFSKVVQRWHDELSLEGHPLAERYMRPGGTVVCELEISPFHELGCSVGLDDKPIRDSKFLASLIYRSHSGNNRVFTPSDQKPMFVFNVEVMEMQKRLTLPSLVGLYQVQKKTPDIFAGPLFQAIDGSFKSILGSMEWKSSLSGLRDNHRTPSMIEGRSEVVDCVSQNADQLIGERFSRSDAEHLISGIRICFEIDCVRVSISEELRSAVNVVDVLFGPFNL